MEPAISVVIATVGRPEKFGPSLAAYDHLDPGTPPFEVIVVLDGPDAVSRALASRPHRFPVTVLEQPHMGNGPAKNRGAEQARAPYLVFLNDDTRPDPGCLLAHRAAQERHGPCIVVGRVDWDPAREITLYMTWLAPHGHQFNFDRLSPHGLVKWDACWGAHLGLPRAWLLDEPFDPGFPFTALEDGEWAFRQERRGRPTRYIPEALCLHDHRYDGAADYRGRARIAGAASRYVVRRHPRLAWPLILRPIAAAVVLTPLLLWPGRWQRGSLWDLDFRWNYMLGMLSRQRHARLSAGN